MVISRASEAAKAVVKILLIEDDDAHAELIERAFLISERQIGVNRARTLCEAREWLAQQRPDLVIADLRLPDGRGVEIVPSHDDEGRIYPVIVMTSYGDEKIAVEALKAGALDYVVKSASAFTDISRIAERAMREWDQIIARKHAEEQVNARTRKLLALSHIGQQALFGNGVSALMTSAVRLISDTLAASSVLLFERHPDSEFLQLRASAGASRAHETQADGDWCCRKPSIRGGVSTIIGRLEQPLGALCALSDTTREFCDNDIRFLDSVANVIALALERQRIEARVHKLQNELLRATKIRAMGELGTALAHELNQPLAAVMNYVQASRRLLAASDGSVTKETLTLMDEAVNQAERAGRILHRLRRFIEKGELQRTECDLNEVLRDAARLAFGEAMERNVCVQFEFGEDLPNVFIDQVQVQLVAFNLARNALEALKTSATRNITLKTLRNGDATVEALVQDTGPGIDQGMIEHLFTAGFSTKEQGMGVGLSISRSIVEAHGGRLWATSTPQGATFHFTVPAVGANRGE